MFSDKMKVRCSGPKAAWARLYTKLVVVGVMCLIPLGAMPAAEEQRWLDLFLLVVVLGVMWV